MGREKKPPRERVEFPLTKKHFSLDAVPLRATIAGQEFELAPRTFSSGSVGYYLAVKIVLAFDGVPVKYQGQVMLTAVNSKDAPAG
ncbi:MAG: hypothetical protein ACRC7O_06250 [Fimbriiglobus sp.]